jgi:arsenite oxidase small subunit
MANKKPIDRRQFVKICATAAATVGSNPAVLATTSTTALTFNRVQLLNEFDQPLKLSELSVGENYLFFYPYVSTPCFLVDLGRAVDPTGNLKTADGESYSYRGGVGANRSVVAFSAICAHKMSHPSRNISFINYRSETVQFWDNRDKTQTRDSVIYCCSEGSVYDPAQGCEVLGGPAPQPLAAIVLEHDEATDGVFAVGTAGGTMFAPYFEKFWHRLQLEFETENVEQKVTGATPIVRLQDYCRRQVLCGT